MTKLKEQILKLRDEGKTYKQIKEITGASKGTIAYHCGEGQKEKLLQKQKIRREKNVLLRKVERFLCEKPGNGRRKTNISSQKGLQNLVTHFCRKKDKKTDKFSYHDIIKLYGKNTKCYLTGRDINLLEPKTYSFDHKIPISKGGNNTLENLGIARREANYAKSDLLIEEFIELCKDVLIHNGFEVSKK